jgi:hypothetical protein
MQDDPLEDVIEDDDFFGEEVAVTAPAPGMTQGTYVGEYGDSGRLPYALDDLDDIPQRFFAFTTLSLFACFILMVICAGFLISMFLGYV